MSQNSKEQAQAYFEDIREQLEKEDMDEPLSLTVRSEWKTPGEKLTPAEYEILLCTGGPAVRVYGDLDDHCEPTTAKLQHQDWFEGWTTYHAADEQVLLQYASRFYWGEGA